MPDAPLFLGLTRPAKIFGLPVGYFVSLLLVAVVPFVALDEWRFLLILVVGYPILWLVADRHPNFWQITAVVLSTTPMTSNRRRHEGDKYVS
jgi:type IV secretory pathway VirB3-like protein